MSLFDRLADDLEAKDRDLRLACHNDPAAFAREFIVWPEGQTLVEYQAEIMSDLVRYKRESARGPHGLGKSATSAIVILWFALTRERAHVPWKVLTTASAWRQLEKFLWPEVHLWAKRLRWDLLGRQPFDPRTELMHTMLRLEYGEAFAGASDDPALLEGAHADSVLIVFDESKSIIGATWEALEGALSGQGEAFALAVSTPGSPSGVFYDIHSRKAGYEDWHVRHVTLDEAIAAGRISQTWADARARQWGKGSAVYKNRVLGEFAATDEDSVCPLEWIEAANRRWEDLQDLGDELGPLTAVGVDVARSGEDRTVLAPKRGDFVEELRKSSREDTMETTGRVVGILEANPGSKAIVDVIGIGAGVVDRLKELGFRRTVGFNASAASHRKDRSGELGFLNQRSAAWWSLREQLDPTFEPTICLPPDDDLTGDLVSPHWAVSSGGKIQVESKDDIRRRLGRSTDCGDAVVMVCDKGNRGSTEVFRQYMERKRAEREEQARNPGSGQRALTNRQANATARRLIRNGPRFADKGRTRCKHGVVGRCPKCALMSAS